MSVSSQRVACSPDHELLNNQDDQESKRDIAMSSQTSSILESPEHDPDANTMNDVEGAETAPEPPQTRPSYSQASLSSSSSIPSLSGSPPTLHSSEPTRSVQSSHPIVQQDDIHESRPRTAIGMNRRDAFLSVPGTYRKILDLREQEEAGPTTPVSCVGDKEHQSVRSHQESSPEEHYCDGPSHDLTLHDYNPYDASSTHDVFSQTGLSFDRSSQTSPLRNESLHQSSSNEEIAHNASDPTEKAGGRENTNETLQSEVVGDATPYQEDNSSPICSPPWYLASMPPFSSLVPTPTKQDTGTSLGRPTSPLHRSLHAPDRFDHWGQELRDVIQAQGEGIREVLGGIEVRMDALQSEIRDGLREEVKNQSETMKHGLSVEIGKFMNALDTLLSEFDNPASSILFELRELGPQMVRAEERVHLQMRELRDDIGRLTLDMGEVREMGDTGTIDADSDCDALVSQVDELRDRVNVLDREMSSISHRQNELRTTVRLQTTRSEVAREATQASLDSLMEAMETMKIECRNRHAIAQEDILRESASQCTTLEKDKSHWCDMPKSHHECLAKLIARGYINSPNDDLKTSLESFTDTLINALRTDLQNLRIDLDNTHKTFLAQIAGGFDRDSLARAQEMEASATQSTTASEKHDNEAQENVKGSVKAGKRVRFEDAVPGGEPRKQLNGAGVLNPVSSSSALTASKCYLFCSIGSPVLYFIACVVVLGVSWLFVTSRR